MKDHWEWTDDKLSQLNVCGLLQYLYQLPYTSNMDKVKITGPEDFVYLGETEGWGWGWGGMYQNITF